MTREENKKLAESLRPILEAVVEAAEKEDVRIHLFAANDYKERYGNLEIKDYELIIIDDEIALHYRPKGQVKEWETEWREKYERATKTDDKKS